MTAFALISFASFLITLVCGLVVFMQDVRGRVNRSFFLLCIAVAYWSICEYHLRAARSAEVAALWGRCFVFWPFAISLIAHFLATYTEPQRRRPVGFYAAIHLPAAMLTLVGIFTTLVSAAPVKVAWGYTHGMPPTLAAHLVIITWALLIAGYCVRLMVRHVQRAANAAERKRATVVLYGLALPVASGLITEALLPLVGYRVPEFTTAAFAGCCLIVGYGMWKHRLFLLDHKLAEAQRLSDTIIDTLPGVFYLIDTDGQFARWNNNFERVTGYGAAEMRQLVATDLFEGADKELIAERMAEVFEGGESSAEATLRFKDGGWAPYFFTGRRVILESKPFLVGVGIDVSEQKRLEGELIQSQKMQAVGTLAGGIAHDFNNLLTVILGSAEITTAAPNLDDELREDLEQITIAGKSAARLTQQLLQFSRKQVMKPKVVELPRVVEPLSSMLQRLIGEDIHLELDFEEELWSVAVDMASIEQVLVNLVVNARDALPKGGRIRVQGTNCQLADGALSQAPTAPRGPYVRLSIIDDGTGIADDVLEHLFEPFYTTKGKGRGTGLGLSVVYGIVRQHDGWLQVTSEPGQGSRFDVYLPRSAIATDPDAQPQDTSRDSGIQGLRILLIEDESAVLRFATAALRRKGCEVVSAAGFTEGLATFEAEKASINLLFSDVILPDGNGLELVRRIRASHPELPVLMTSGYTGDRSRVEKILGEGLRYLQKPYRLADLYRELGAAVADQSRRAASRSDNAAV